VILRYPADPTAFGVGSPDYLGYGPEAGIGQHINGLLMFFPQVLDDGTGGVAVAAHRKAFTPPLEITEGLLAFSLPRCFGLKIHLQSRVKGPFT
jgi:hypothetical protein